MSPSVRRAAIAAALPLLLVAGVARAAETIRFAIPAGLSYRFEQSSTMDLDVAVDMDGRRMSDRQRIVQTLRGTATILASEDGRPTRARIAFDRASGGSTTMMNQEMPQPFALAGRTVELALDGTRVLALEPPAGDPPLPTIDLATQRTIADVVAADAEMLPDGPVAVGDTWTARPRRAGDQVHPTLTFRVERFADRDGRRVAELSVEGRLASATDAMQLDGRVTGPSVVDLATGLTLESRLSGRLTTASEMAQGGMTMRMNGQGTVEQAARVTLDAGAVAGGPSPAGGGDDAPAPAPSGDATLDGTWTGDGLEMRVEGDAVRLTMGELAVAGELEERAGGRFGGRFMHQGATFPFTGTWTGDEATFTTGGRTYRLRRPAANPLGGPAGGPTNPLGGAGAGAADAAGGGGTDEAGPAPRDGAPDLSDPDAVARATEGWTRHRHVSGASFRHPEDWRVQAMPGGLVISPPDLQAADESIIAVGTPAEGETDPAGPRAVQAMDAVVARSMPMLRRTEAPRSVPTPGERPGAAYEYVGQAPDGRTLRCTMLVRIVNDVALGFAVIGLEQRVAARVPTVRLMFATLAHERDAGPDAGPGGGAGAKAGGGGATPPGDARLVGAFRGESIRAPGPGGVSVSTQLIWAFNADGTVLHGARSAMNASRRDAGGNLVWTFDGESGASMRRGRWSTSGDVLTVRWSDGGVSRFRYGFEPDGSLVHRNVRTGRLINFYPRVR